MFQALQQKVAPLTQAHQAAGGDVETQAQVCPPQGIRLPAESALGPHPGLTWALSIFTVPRPFTTHTPWVPSTCVYRGHQSPSQMAAMGSRGPWRSLGFLGLSLGLSHPGGPENQLLMWAPALRSQCFHALSRS